MRALRLLAVLAIASTSLAAAPAPKKAAPRPVAATANWNAVVARTASGTHVLGNPNAKVRLGEYVSYTYVFGLGLGLFALGLALLVRYHRDLQNS